MKIALATDHAGFELMRQLEAFLAQNGYECKDFGPDKISPNDDYPDFIFPAAQAVASGECDAGIIMGSSGQGEAMAANRVKGARCAVFYGASSTPSAIDIAGSPARDQYEILRLTRQHNHANVLSLAARFLTLEEAQHAVMTWLGTRYSNEERHKRRVAKLDQMPNVSNSHPRPPAKIDTRTQPRPEQSPQESNDGTAGVLRVQH